MPPRGAHGLTIDNPSSARASGADEAASALAREAAEPRLGPDSLFQPGVPTATLTKHRHTGTGVYPGVARDYWVYIPAQYDGGKSAALIVFQDARLYLAETFNASEWFEDNFADREADKVQRLGPDAVNPHRVSCKKLTR